jgi:hypothetical protein
VTEQYRESRWFLNPGWMSWEKTKPGFYPEGAVAEVELRIDSEDIRKLIQALDEAGWIVPRLDVRLREEDLKITPRLIDLLGRSRT